MSREDNIVKLAGQTFYANFSKRNQMSGKYQVDLSIDEDTVKMLKEKGIEVKNKGDARGNYVTLKTDFEPLVVDPDRNPLQEGTIIGNGSVVTAVANIYDWKWKNKTGKGLGLKGVQVISLVEYTPTTFNMFDDNEE